MADVIWMAPDGSWGSCDRENLLIVDSDTLTDDEWEAIHEAAEIGADMEIYDILLAKVNG